MKLYKIFSLCATIVFAAVGLTFLFFADPVLVFFNNISSVLNFTEAPLNGVNFYLALASAYMYLVTALAFLMYRNPHNKSYPFLLLQGKAASSLVSLYLFLAHQPFLIYIANFVVDGCIAVIVFILMKKIED